MPDLYLVDTSAWIFALRRPPREVIRRRVYQLLELDMVATCGLVELELLADRDFDLVAGHSELRVESLVDAVSP